MFKEYDRKTDTYVKKIKTMRKTWSFFMCKRGGRMQKTTNYNLNKPEATDFYSVEDFNQNAEIIDAKLKEIEDKASSGANNQVQFTETDPGADASVEYADGTVIAVYE